MSVLKVNVRAKRDIVTEKDFTIALAGDTGIAVSGAKPHDDDNYGKVLVYFKAREHGYWCAPSDLACAEKLAGFIAVKPVEVVPPVLPAADGEYSYHFGSNLKIIRDSRGLSQTDLGKKMARHGVEAAQSTICYRENNALCPGGKFVNAAAEALKVPAFVFFLPLNDCSIFMDAKKFIMCMSSGLCEV